MSETGIDSRSEGLDRPAAPERAGAAPSRDREAAYPLTAASAQPSRAIRLPALAVGVATFTGLYLTSRYSYQLFHGLAEVLGVAIAFGIFMVAWNSRWVQDNGYLFLVGVAAGSVAFLDVLHAFAYKGMGVFPGDDPDLPTQLWIASRYVWSLSLLAAPLALGKRPRPALTLALHILVVALLLLSIFRWQVFPSCYVEGKGLTAFKIWSEYVICLILLAAWAHVHARREHFEPKVPRLIGASLLITIATEIAFTSYVSVIGAANLVGHLLEIASLYPLYDAFVVTGFTQPLSLLFRDLQRSQAALQESDRLLHALMEYVPEGLAIADAPDAELRLVSRAGAELAGLERDELEGKAATEQQDALGVLRADGTSPAEPWELPLYRAAALGELVKGEEWVLRTSSGEQIPVLCTAGPIRDEAGRVTGGVCAWRDIRPLKAAQAATEQAYERKRYVAEYLQKALFSEVTLNGQGRMAAAYIPAQGDLVVGGDFYDVFNTAEGQVALLIGDVSGKGVEATAAASTARSILRAYVFETSAAADSLSRANRVLTSQILDATQHVTVFLGLLDPESGVLRYVSAGHCPPVLCRVSGALEVLESFDFPIGILEAHRFAEQEVRMEPGDLLILYTDGLEDVRSEQGPFGHEGVLRTIEGLRSRSPQEAVSALLTATSQWSGNHRDDDTALLAFERTEPPG